MRLQRIGTNFLVIMVLTMLLSDQLTAQIFKPKQSQIASEQPAKRQTTSEEPKASVPRSTSTQWSNAWRLTLGGGPATTFGDIKQNPFLPSMDELRFGGTFLIERQLSPVFSLRGQAVYAKYAGYWPSSNIDFEADNIEFNLNTAIDLNNLFGKKRKDRFFTTSIILGTGIANFNTTLYQTSSKTALASNGYGNGASFGGRTLEPFLMAGLGMDFRLDENWSIRLESGNRVMNSDKFDMYENNVNDAYNFTSVGISYTFNSGKKRVSKVPESEPSEPVAQVKNEPVTPESSINQVVEVLAIDKVAEEALKPVIVETPVVEKVTKVESKKEMASNDVEYRVQIRAKYEGKISKNELSKKYNIAIEEINESTHNKYYIYTVGSYPTYENAADKRNEIKTVNKVYDAFVVAFKNGERLDKLPK